MEKQKEKIIAIFGIVFLIVFSLAFIAFAKPEMFRLADIGYRTCPGDTMTVTSIDSVKFLPMEDLFGNDEAWLATFRNLPHGQCLTGTFYENDIEDPNYPDKEVQYGFTLDLANSIQEHRYALAGARSTHIVTVDYFATTWNFLGYYPSEQEMIDTVCKPEANGKTIFRAVLYEGHAVTADKIACFYLAGNTHVARDIDFSETYWEADVIFEGDKTDKPYSGTITSHDKNINIPLENYGSTKAYVRWIGNLVNEKQTPDESDVLVIDNNKIISEAAYDEYDDYYNGGGTDSWNYCLTNARDSGISQVNYCRDRYNYYANKALTKANFCVYGWEGYATECSEVKNGQVIVQGRILIPEFQLIIDADELGLVQQWGKPEITSVQAATFNAGDRGIAMANVKNVGTATEGFNVYANCLNSNDIWVDSGSKIESIAPGATKQVSITMSAQGEDDFTSDCTVYAEGFMYTDEYTWTQGVTGDTGPGGECWKIVTVGTRRCSLTNGQQIEECLADGRWVVSWCKTTEHCEERTTGTVCVEGIVPCGDGFCDTAKGENEQNCPSDCKQWYKEYWWIIVIIALAGFLGWYYYKSGGRRGWTPPKKVTNYYRRPRGRY